MPFAYPLDDEHTNPLACSPLSIAVITTQKFEG